MTPRKEGGRLLGRRNWFTALCHPQLCTLYWGRRISWFLSAWIHNFVLNAVLILVGQKLQAQYGLVRGKRWKDRYNFNSYAASCSKSGLYASNESHVCPLSYGVWWVYVLPEAAEWQTKMKRESGRGQPDLTVQNSKQNNPVWKWKMDCPSHSGCHLAVPWSWASYHTSSERGHSGLSTDIKIWPIVLLIGII